MKKNQKAFISIILCCLMFFICACNKQTAELNSFEQNRKSGAIGTFNLISPVLNAELESNMLTFEWEAASNAEYYSLEISRSQTFEQNQTVLKKDNIAATKYNVTSLFSWNRPYFWRVTAHNSDTRKAAESPRGFKSVIGGMGLNIPIGLGKLEDYSFQPDGYRGGITIENASDGHFDTEVPSLKVSYGDDINSIGWLIAEYYGTFSFYGADAVYFKFESEGASAKFKIRFSQADGSLFGAAFTAKSGVNEIVIPFSSGFDWDAANSGPGASGLLDFEVVNRIDIIVESCFGAGNAYIGNITPVLAADFEENPEDVSYETTVPFLIDNFESYADNAALRSKWQVTGTAYAQPADGSVVKSTGIDKMMGSYGIGFQLKTDAAGWFSYEYSLERFLDNIQADALRLWLKAGSLPLEVRITLINNSLTPIRYEYTISTVASVWNQYTIPFSEFSGGILNIKNIRKIEIAVNSPSNNDNWSSINLFADDIQIVKQ